MKAEGWMLGNKKIDYWFFYRKDATKEKEGHYINGNKESWWVFYDKLEKVSHKCQFKNNIKNGYCLIYKNNNLIKASKFKDGKLIKEWKDFASFRKENNLSDLRQ
jgi:antitoxin component YwqK of YwqJK toxin-antitoxin module